jgi:hypothetical protein
MSPAPAAAAAAAAPAGADAAYHAPAPPRYPVGFSGRDLRDVCEQTERRWAAKVIRKQVAADQAPPLSEYLEAAAARMAHAGTGAACAAHAAAAAAGRGRYTLQLPGTNM